MSVKDCAIKDIKDDLEKNHKSFLAFRKELDPVMGRLVRSQIKNQYSITPHHSRPSHFNSQIVAHCLFSKATGSVSLTNYTQYYGKE